MDLLAHAALAAAADYQHAAEGQQARQSQDRGKLRQPGRLEAEAAEMFAHIDAAGGGSMLEGALRLIDEGWYQSGIADAAYEFEKKVNSGRRVVVGASAFTEGGADDDIDLLKITGEDEQRQIKRLQQVRADRDSASVERALTDLRRAAETDANLMPHLIDTVRTRASLGEVTGALADVFGRHVERPFL